MTYIEPLISVWLALAFAGWVAIRRNGQSRGARLTLWGLVGLTLTCWHPAEWLFSRPLEMPFPDRPVDGRGAQAIVVPGSDFEDPTAGRPFPVADWDTYGRCMLAAWIYRNGPAHPVLVSGHWATGIMRRILENQGVPGEAIWEEKAARSTHENAAFSAGILRHHGIATIILVGDARAMLRAKMCFEKEGFGVIPAVWRRLPFTPDLRHLLPGWKAAASNGETLHEAVGLLWYRLRGWV